MIEPETRWFETRKYDDRQTATVVTIVEQNCLCGYYHKYKLLMNKEDNA